MNAIAAQATVQRAPEMVIVNDGMPVEHVGQTSGSARLLMIAVPGVLALIIGVAVGKIGSSASSYNDGLKGAKAILGDRSSKNTVAFLKKTLSDLDSALDDAAHNGFKPNADLDKRLQKIALDLEVKSELVFRAKENSLDAEVAGQILSFYAGVQEIKDMLDQHNKAALGDDMALMKKGKDAADAANADGFFKYGVLMQARTDTDHLDFGAKVVELAGVYCGTGASPVPRCADGETPTAYAYRNEPGATPIKGDLVTDGSDSVPTKKLVPLLQNGIRDSLIKGGEPTVSEVYYARRLRSIYERVHGKQDKSSGGLLDDGNKLETRLQTEAAKSPRFSFFM
ncbi:MAG TPA: hypothetical protein VLX92_23490 [Kofleriaceae bacterium]|nr:hypothetical protein [Kofleriaceae bacterium]